MSCPRDLWHHRSKVKGSKNENPIFAIIWMSESQNDFEVPHISSKWNQKNTQIWSKVTGHGNKGQISKMLMNYTQLRMNSWIATQRQRHLKLSWYSTQTRFQTILFASWGEGGWRLVRLNASIPASFSRAATPCCNNLYLARQISYSREIIRTHIAWKCLRTENFIKCAQIAQSILLWPTDIVRVYPGRDWTAHEVHIDHIWPRVVYQTIASTVMQPTRGHQCNKKKKFCMEYCGAIGDEICNSMDCLLVVCCGGFV